MVGCCVSCGSYKVRGHAPCAEVREKTQPELQPRPWPGQDHSGPAVTSSGIFSWEAPRPVEDSLVACWWAPQYGITRFVVIPKQGDIYLGHLYKSYNPNNIYTQHVMLAFTTSFHGDGFSCCSYEMHIVATKPLQAFLEACWMPDKSWCKPIVVVLCLLPDF